MTKNNTYLDPNHIQDLEKKYMQEIWNQIESEEFNYTLKNISKKINENFSSWKIRFNMKNFFNIPFERICKYYLYKELSEKPWASPISSDLAFYPKDNDSIINIDAKTINSNPAANAGDVYDLQVKINQTGLYNGAIKEDYNIKNSGLNFAGTIFEGAMPKYAKDFINEKDLPVLTYTLKCIYYSDHLKNEFYLDKIFLTNIPNPIVYEKNWPGENKIVNFKTYKYITDFPGLNIKKYKRILESDFNKKDKIEFERYGKTFFLDKDLKNPLPGYEKFNLAWTIVRNGSGQNTTWGYEIPIEGDSVRLVKRPYREDSEGKEWKGLLEKGLSSSS
jgi:hypothetical protein